MSSKTKLLKLINDTNPIPIPLTFSQVRLLDPVIDEGDNWNTKVRIVAMESSYYTGYQDVYYKRNQLNKLINTGYGFLSETPFTFEKIISLLNDERNADIDSSEIEYVSLENLSIGEIANITLHAHPSSHGWIGDVEFNAVYGLSSDINELHQIVNHTLPEPGYITWDVSHG